MIPARRRPAPLPPVLPPPPSRSARWVCAALAGILAACASGHSSSPPILAKEDVSAPAPPSEPPPTPEPPAKEPPKELPGGGRTLFPQHRLVGFCGTPGAPALGALQGNLPARAKTLEAQAAKYAKGRDIIPVFELIAVVVQGSPGPDGKYRHRVDPSVVDEYLRVARLHKAILLLNIQPGWSDFLTEVQSFEKYLHEPDVGIALDPEWSMKPKQTPGRFYGQTTGEIMNDVAAYLSGIIKADDLPEKALVFHQVNRFVLKDEAVIGSYPGIVFIKSVDGLGPVNAKIATYNNLMETMVKGVHPGFKLFFDEDTRNSSRLMSANEVLALSPQPEYVMYE